MSATRKTKPDASGPHQDDFYATPAWAVDVIVPHVLADLRLCGRGIIADPGCGDGAIIRSFLGAGVGRGSLWGWDIRCDAVEATQGLGVEAWCVDWLGDHPSWRLSAVGAFVMNPPYGGRKNLAQRFITAAIQRAEPGASIWALLRLNWLLDGEASHGRQTWLRQGPGAPDVYAMNRRPSFTGDGRADATTYAWMRWVVGSPMEVSSFRLLDCHRVERPS